jgi:hypothetical protein
MESSAESVLRDLEAKGVSVADIAKVLAAACPDFHLLPLPVGIRKAAGLPDVRMLDLKGATTCALHAQHAYVGAEVRETPKDFVFPEPPLVEKPVLLSAEGGEDGGE